MNISPKHIYAAVAILLIGLVLIIGGSAFVATKMNIVRFNQVSDDMKPIHEQAKEDKVSASKAEDVNGKALAAALAVIAAQKSQPVVTPVDYDRIAQMIESRMGVKAEVKATELPNAPSATLPAKQLRDYMSDCDAVTAEYGSCKQSVINVQKKLDAEVSDHEATKKELTAAKKAMKGGSFFARLKGNTRWLVIGGAAATAAVCGTGHCK